MINPYGPWATAINAGPNPQLSTFWRQRLTMLVPASRTRPVLSRRAMLALIGAGVATCSLPTIRGASAWAEPLKRADVSAKEILTAWRKRQASIESFQYQCQLKDKKTLPKAEVVVAQTFIFSLSGDKIAWSLFGEQWNDRANARQVMKQKAAFDGVYTRRLYDGRLRGGNLAGSDGPRDDRAFVRNYMNQTPIWLWFSPLVHLHGQDYFPEKMTVADLHARRDGHDCVELTMVRTNPSWKASLYVDPARDYVPIQFVQTKDGADMQDLAIRYVRDEKVGWRVSGWNDKSVWYKRDVSCEVAACSINASIGDEVFALEFPQGTPVVEPHGENETEAWKYFIALAGGKRRYVSKDEYDKYFAAPAQAAPNP